MYSPLSLERARELVKRWIKEQGLTVVEAGRDYIIAQEGDNDVYIKLFFPPELAEPEELVRVVTELARARDKYNKAYIAVPQNIADLVDGTLLKRADIGLLVVDHEHETVIERVKSPPISIRRTYMESTNMESYIFNIVRKVVNEVLSKVLNDIRNIKEKVAALEKSLEKSSETPSRGSMIERIQREIERLWEVVDRLKLDLARLSDKIALLEAQYGKEITISPKARTETVTLRQEISKEKETHEELPEFLRDNPWVSILRQKAKETQS